MPKAHLTPAFAANAGCEVGKKKTDWYDDTVLGFVLECRCTGGKTYYIRYLDQSGTQKQHKIGGYNDVTFAAAKKKAQQLRSEVVMGGDPSAQKALVKSIPMYGDLSTKHLDFIKDSKSYASVEMCMRVHIVPKWGKTRLTDMNSRSMAQWLSEKRASGLSPASVEKLRVIIGRSFVLGASWDIPGTERNPTRGIPRTPLNNGRERFLSAEEATRLREAVAASQNPQLQHVVGLLLLTGARLRELLDAKWENVDVKRRSWLIPTSKTGKARHVPLSTAALAIIEQLPRFKDCPWLVPNPETRLPFVSIKHGWQRAIREARLPGLRLHDLRHSAASFMVNSGVDLFAVGKVLGHASYQSTQRYSHLANDTLLKAVEAGAAKQIT
ncbi:Tyrosine recombinase XerC [Brevundimonas vesicularis]|uniref:Tyrosine recombinase XerC n=1 Tax=Brevundimonas vesicularis TaxID=41276 RepID=A0A2X1BDG9_BREVE|nr:site-specific integrase [Brevundimonas vesicularis]SPU54558.1 Tyrosine recombinase XerC [Brevundimonas vesicularis]